MELGWEHSFPPFFTLQPHLETRTRQLQAWADLLLTYSKLHNQHILDLSLNHPLFTNSTINRTFPTEGILALLHFMQTTKNSEPLDKTKARWFILWKTIDEFSSTIYNWAKNSGLLNTVCTLYEIQNSDHPDLKGMNDELLLKILKNLEKENKAELITLDDGTGVKFF